MKFVDLEGIALWTMHFTRFYTFLPEEHLLSMCILHCVLPLLAASLSFPQLCAQRQAEWPVQNSRTAIRAIGGTHVLWQLQSVENNSLYSFAPPVLPIENGSWTAAVDRFAPDGPVTEAAGIREYSMRGTLRGHSRFTLRLTFRLGADQRVVRFRYSLETNEPSAVSSFSAGPLEYLRVAVSPRSHIRELQLSQFMALTHSYTLQETSQPFPSIRGQSGLMGPLVTVANGTHHLLLAYEHGSTVPEVFLRFRVRDEAIALQAAKPNTLPGERVDAARSSTWT